MRVLRYAVLSERRSSGLGTARSGFFPLIEDETLGLVLRPFDLATNKVLATAGWLEVRDWIDAITCDQRLQPTVAPGNCTPTAIQPR